MMLSTLALLAVFNWYNESRNIIARDTCIAIYSIIMIFCSILLMKSFVGN